jgi:hypothetical protein
MKLRTNYSRASISFALVLAVVTVFTLRSFAAPEVIKSGDPSPAQDCTGSLTVKAGQVTINGNAAQTGATVMTGSVITTSSNGKAIVDLGALGRIEVGDNTTVTLTCVAGLLEIKTNCSRTQVEVRRGTADVKSPKSETLNAGKKAKYDGAVELTSAGGVDLKIECGGGKVGAGTRIGPGLLGLLALLAVGGAVATGVGVGSGGTEGASLPTSPIR